METVLVETWGSQADNYCVKAEGRQIPGRKKPALSATWQVEKPDTQGLGIARASPESELEKVCWLQEQAYMQE